MTDLFPNVPPGAKPSFDDLVDAVTKLHDAQSANALPPTLAILQRKLEQTWQPDASVLLQPGSITADMLPTSMLDSGKTAPLLAADWVNFGSTFEEASYSQRGQVARLQGLVKKTSALSLPETIFTLPSALCPASDLLFAVISNGAIGRVDVQAGGDVVVQAGDASYVNLSGISFVIGT